ncbi:type 1 glutamine amidotransferase [Solimonas terrae]|uniref:Type 1 glutamine amidotransferase n=1 Tax=Solimonas terrae TaxID=1396819 RepID=A0A6M2BSG1_9GAMM|nr:type 1 glutamine amidotransferase [Solimonas terrae]
MLEGTFPASDALSWGGSGAERERRARNSSSAGRALRKTGGLHGKTFAILATHGFEQSELMKPRQALLKAGAEVEIVSLGKKPIKGWKKQDWTEAIEVDLDLNAASPSRYDGLVLPGGTLNADTLRSEPRAITFIKDFFDNGKPVAAICHAPWLLVEARVVDGHRLTSWPSLKTDVRNAGGEWLDEEVVVDDQLLTSRKPDDIPAFTDAMIGLFAQHKRRDNARTTIGPTDV